MISYTEKPWGREDGCYYQTKCQSSNRLLSGRINLNATVVADRLINPSIPLHVHHCTRLDVHMDVPSAAHLALSASSQAVFALVNESVRYVHATSLVSVLSPARPYCKAESVNYVGVLESWPTTTISRYGPRYGVPGIASSSWSPLLKGKQGHGDA
ncbi:hypothetical protein BD413DRAFT_312210 [Trametes elegans]|nr:hypothetical protein BD413DRAFT_312210 [Trametes elegans]